VGAQQRGGLDQAVDTVAAGEADVVANGDVIEAGGGDRLGELGEAALPVAEILLAQHDPGRQPRAGGLARVLSGSVMN
jgi:hypothetical protein